MKSLFFATFLFSVSLCFGQSTLINPKTKCSYTLPWTCETCTFNWTGDCLNNVPEGEGVLTVFNEGDEIMRYEGAMKGGNFNGFGKYHDGMNEMEGNFINGNLAMYSNPYNAGIDTTKFNKSDDWELKSQITKQLDNLFFIFPTAGYAFEHKDALVEECLVAFDKNCKILNLPNYSAFTKIRFITSKKEMLFASNIAVGGQANPITRTIDLVLTNEDERADKKTTKAPIVHEIMHMVAMTMWGMPSQNLTWLNEGLATYANNNCSGYTVAEIYRYFLAKDKLLPMESLTANFYQTEEMIGYHQSAYLVEYLISKYGIQKIETLWTSGFSNFENIYGLPFSKMEAEINEAVVKAYPKVPAIEWEIFKEGCE